MQLDVCWRQNNILWRMVEGGSVWSGDVQEGETGPSVKTSCSTVNGVYGTSRDGRNFSVFYSIPYAEPPVGELRFEPPQPIKNCPAVIDATKQGPPCWQPNWLFPEIKAPFVGSEDCLNLNIYTPKIDCDELLPVMVYFIEGSWIMNGATRGLHGPRYMMDEDIVLVVPNHRLNIFGYMSTEDYVVPGNMALKDQVAVLQYVRDNIEYFCGDPDSVTIFGHSAGASAVSLHMRSPLSKGLFKNGISIGGTANSQFSLIGVGSPLKFTRDVAADVNCTRNCTRDMVNCLKQVKAEDLERQFVIRTVSQLEVKVQLLPVIEEKDVVGAFMTRTSLVTKSDYPWITGFTAKDVAYKYAAYCKTPLGLKKTLARLDTEFTSGRGAMSLLIDDTSSRPNVEAAKIKQFYFQNKAISTETKNEFIDMYTHIYIGCPMIHDVFNNLDKTFVYLFDHLGEYTMIYPDGLPKNDSIGTAVHGDLVLYFFTMNVTFPNAKLNASDTNISKMIVKLFVNFAKYGNPTPTGISSNPQNPNSTDLVFWKPFGRNYEYLRIKTNSVTLEKGLLRKEYAFWKTLKVTDLLRSKFNSYGHRKND